MKVIGDVNDAVIPMSWADLMPQGMKNVIAEALDMSKPTHSMFFAYLNGNPNILKDDECQVLIYNTKSKDMNIITMDKNDILEIDNKKGAKIKSLPSLTETFWLINDSVVGWNARVVKVWLSNLGIKVTIPAMSDVKPVTDDDKALEFLLNNMHNETVTYNGQTEVRKVASLDTWLEAARIARQQDEEDVWSNSSNVNTDDDDDDDDGSARIIK